MLSHRVNNQCVKCNTTVEFLDLPIGIFMHNPILYDEDLAGWVCGYCNKFVCESCFRPTMQLTRNDCCPLCKKVIKDKLLPYVPVHKQISFEKLLNKPSRRKRIFLFTVEFLGVSSAAVTLGLLFILLYMGYSHRVETSPGIVFYSPAVKAFGDIIRSIGPFIILSVIEIVIIFFFVFHIKNGHPTNCNCLTCFIKSGRINMKGLAIDEKLKGIWLCSNEHHDQSLYIQYEFYRLDEFNSIFVNPTTAQIVRRVSGQWGILPGYLVWIYNGHEEINPFEEVRRTSSWSKPSEIEGFTIRESDGSLSLFKRLTQRLEFSVTADMHGYLTWDIR
jgi:hypothetical protein